MATLTASPISLPPMLSLDEKDLPEIKDWKVGGKYKLVMTVEQIHASQGDEYGEGKKSPMRARFKVLNVSPVESNEKSDKETKIDKMKEKAESY